ncbi:hypothetical protein R1sor_021790 [Riccia sorocarpa]|uniref:protein-histidine N-methyltransferase n=1 Tax=Riccia sorocarpa TaxID=122646 RepID=A0ABD3GM98_9MARC
MGQKSRATSGNTVASAAVDKRKKDKTVHVLDGLVADLARRTQSGLEGSGPEQHLESIKAIHRLLMQIQKLERPFLSQPSGYDVFTRLKVLEGWLKEQGVQTDGLKLEGGLPEGAGVVATQACEEGQPLCTVPANVMMTTATAIRSKNDVGLLYKADPVLRQMPTLILALHLLFEKVEFQILHRPADDPSNWAGYIASLPGQGASDGGSDSSSDSFLMPLAFSLETIEALKGTAVLVEMHKAVRNYARQYAHVRLMLRQLKGQSPVIDSASNWFTWAEFRWAASIVMTRQNPIPGTPDMEMGQALALIPLLDMFNHEEGEITCHFSVSHQQMELTAKRRFEAGEQVYISYGYRPNSALLLYSGFVPDNNTKDRIRIPVELSPEDPLYQKKVALLKWLELPASGWLELFHDGTPSPELATWIKVAIMTDPAVVTENLRAAIASRAQETAAILQYKAALREAEEKARSGLHQAALEASNTMSISEVSETEKEVSDGRKEDSQAVEEAGTENGSVEAVEDESTVEKITGNGLDSADPSLSVPEERRDSEVKAEEETAVGQEGFETSVAQDGSSGEVNDGVAAVDSDKIVDEAEAELVPDVQYLGEYLFPAEAALLAEICRDRLTEFDDRDFSLSGADDGAPKGLGGLGLVGGQKNVQSKSSPARRELLMAMKIRRQEQQTLLKAVERGVNYQYSQPHAHQHAHQHAHHHSHIHSKECRHHCC